MGEQPDTNRRRLVLHPRTAAARRLDRSRNYGSHVRGFTIQDDEVFAFVADQRRSSVRYLLFILIPLLMMLVGIVFLPNALDQSIRGVPLEWLLLGPATLFFIVFLAWRHDRTTLRREQLWANDHQGDRQ